jgi:hypothetical protein
MIEADKAFFTLLRQFLFAKAAAGHAVRSIDVKLGNKRLK